MKNLRLILGCSALALLSLSVLVLSWNHIAIQRPVSQKLSVDPRNEGIEIRTRYYRFVNRNVLVFDLRSVSPDNSMADVTRVLLQSADALQGREFTYVLLSHRGDPKFMLKGDYFQKLGAEYDIQNPMYTARTLPEHVYYPDGEKVFGTWTGGLLGVLAKQMEDFTVFHKEWYLLDL